MEGDPMNDPDITLMYKIKDGKPVSRDGLHVSVSTKFNRVPLPQKHESNINQVWAKRTAENPRMWNGTKFRLDSVIEQDNKVTFNIGITCYRDFIGTNWSPNAKLYHKLGIQTSGTSQTHMSDALGVGAFVETSDHYVILLRRSQHCGEAQGLLDIPGGHPEPQKLVGKKEMEDIVIESMSCEDVVKEIFDSTLHEIIDEVNIPPSCLSDPVLLGVARNTTSAGRPSSEYYVRCSLSKGEIKSRYQEGTHAEAEESTGIRFVPVADIMNIHNTDIWQDMAPSAKGCIKLYQFSQLSSD